MQNTFDPFDHFGFLTNRIGRLTSDQAKIWLSKKGYDFPPSCIGILADLWLKDGVNQKELGVSLVKTKSSITKMMEQLESAGLIERKIDETDARNKLIFVTAKGNTLKKRLEKARLMHDEKLLTDFTAEEIAITKKVLKGLYLQLTSEK